MTLTKDQVDEIVENVLDSVRNAEDKYLSPTDEAIATAVREALPKDEPLGTWLFRCAFCLNTWTQKATGDETSAPHAKCSVCNMDAKAGF